MPRKILIARLLPLVNSNLVGRILVQLLFNSIVERFFHSFVYEREVHEFLVGRVFDKPVIDVGAQSGHYSLLLSKMAPLVISIEPIPRNYYLIRILTRLYRVHNVIQLNGVVTDKTGLTKIHLTANGSNASIYNIGAYVGSELRVQTLRLSSLVEQFGGAGFIKLDNEGAEFEILRDAASVMNLIDEWIIEVHNPDQFSSIEEILKGHGYHVGTLGSNHVLGRKKRVQRRDKAHVST